LPHRRRDGVVNWNFELDLERIHDPCSAHVGAHDDGGVAPLVDNLADEFRDRSLRNLREGEVILEPQVALGRANETRRRPIRYDFGLHVVQVGCDEPDPPSALATEDIAEGQHRGAGRNPRRRGDPLAEALVAIESEPARRGAIPGNHAHLGVGEEFRGANDLAVVELP
jgi:hypothetical protein